MSLITITGADEKTDLNRLRLLNAEVGILYSATLAGDNRYPRLDWIKEAAKKLPRAALHICGSLARRKLFLRELDHLLPHVQRIQINGKVSYEEVNAICQGWPKHIIITQHKPGNEPALQVTEKNHAILLDQSGGMGIVPKSWDPPMTTKHVGFAGGLGPHNLMKMARKIGPVAKHRWWVDMESSLRTQNWFDLDLATEAVRIFHGAAPQVPTCRVCGCTDTDCTQCIEAQGHPCHWIEPDLCSRCA